MKKQRNIVAVACVSTVFSGLLLVSDKANAVDTVDYISIFVPSACTMSSVVNDGEEHNAELQNGLYREDIGKTTLSIICNDSSGFSVYAVGNTNNEYGNNVLDTNSYDSTFDIASGTATSGNTSNWAMKLSTDSEATYAVSILNGFSSYSMVPSTYTKVATRDSNTGSGSQSANLDTTYAVYINGTQPADMYTGQVKYTLVHPSNEIAPQPQNTEPGYIGYYSNTNVYEGSMGKQQISPSDTSTMLLASNFIRSGYGFAGWNTAYDYSGDFYGPNETIKFEAGQYTDGENGLSLYAVWVKSEGLIQNWVGCSSLSPVLYDSDTGSLTADLTSVTALTDLRDNQTYAVARLADGKCWMIENLRLSSDFTRSESFASLSQGYGQSHLYGNFIGLADSESTNYANTAASNSIYGINGPTVSIGEDDYPKYRIPRYNNNNIVNYDSNPNTGNASYIGYGNYYNWAAAMASTKYYTSGYINNGNEKDQSNIAETSLCPSGWRLPYGSDVRGNTYDGELALLDVAMGGNGVSGSINNKTNTSMSYYWRLFPNNLVYSGSLNGSSINSRGGGGYLWTTTAFDYDTSRGLSINDSHLNPGITPYDKYVGFSIRCKMNN